MNITLGPLAPTPLDVSIRQNAGQVVRQPNGDATPESPAPLVIEDRGFKLEGASSVLDAVRFAAPLIADEERTFTGAIVQAVDGAYWLTEARMPGGLVGSIPIAIDKAGADKHEYLRFFDPTRITVRASADAVKALVASTAWIDLSGGAARTPQAIPA